jgi:hypothetical protein
VPFREAPEKNLEADCIKICGFTVTWQIGLRNNKTLAVILCQLPGYGLLSMALKYARDA